MVQLDYSLFVPNVHFEQIRICDLVSNQEYQRSLSKDHIQRTAENFDLYQINPCKVSRRDGVNYVFDGQHTIEIVALVSGSRETPVWCMVYDDMGYIKEADTFANQQKHVRKLTALDVFNANIEAENEEQLAIKAIVESYQLTITKAKDNCCIGAVGALEYVYRKYGFHTLDRALRLVVMAWEGEAESLTASMIKGVAILIEAYGDKLTDDMFKDKLSAVSPKEIVRSAKERLPGAKGYAEAMFIIYTRKIKYCNLNINDIYNVDKPKKKKRPTDEQSALNDMLFSV